MKAVVQRVGASRVEVSGDIVGAIDRGLLVYLGVAQGDSSRDVDWMADKVTGLRIFEDEQGKMNRDVKDVGGEMLVVSQFTLLGDTRKGRRPSFQGAAAPDVAERLYEGFCAAVRTKGVSVATGRFRADMKVHSLNDGPVTMLIDSREPTSAPSPAAPSGTPSSGT